MRTGALGSGAANALWNGTPIAVAFGGTGATTAATARTNLGLVIGTNVQAWDADLDAIAALSTQAFGRSLLTGVSAVQTRSLLGVLQPVLQTASIVDNTARSTTSLSYTATGITLTLPYNYEKSTNRIRVRFTGFIGASSASPSFVNLRVLRGGVDITPSGMSGAGVAIVSSADDAVCCSFELYDAPGSATRAAYTIDWLTSTSNTAYLGRRGNSGLTTPYTLTLEEISV